MNSDLNATIAHLIQEIQRAPEMGNALMSSYRTEIPDYANLSQAAIENDVLPNSIALIERLLAHIHSGEEHGEDFDEQLRDAAVRRFHQGVSIEALLQSYRLWSRTVWRQIKAVVNPDDPREVMAALEVVERIMNHVDHCSVVVAQAFFAEVAGIRPNRSLLRGDVLDAMLGGHPASVQVERRLSSLAQELTGPHIAVVIRDDHAAKGGSTALHKLVEHVRDNLRPLEDRLTMGVRSNEVVAIYPLSPNETDADMRQACNRLAAGVPRSIVGVGRRHDGLAGVSASYGEAVEAASISTSLDRYGQPTYFRDVLLEHLARTSTYSQSLLEDIFFPLQEYDEQRNATLVLTLHTFYETRYSLTRSAKLLHVHPNTVTYRLRRIHEITGLDPSDPDDLLLLSMGLKLGQISH